MATKNTKRHKKMPPAMIQPAGLKRPPLFFRVSLLCFFVFFVAISARSEEDVIDSPMYKAPELPTRNIEYDFPEGMLVLWLKAFERPEAGLHFKVAEAIAKAQRRGMKGLEAAVAPLRAALDKPDQPPEVRLALAEALIALE